MSTPGSKGRKPWDLDQFEIDQIWAEVLTMGDEPLYLPPEVERLARLAQKAAMESDEREGLVRMYLERWVPENWEDMDLYSRRVFLESDEVGTVQREIVTNMEIWCECFGNSKESLRSLDSYLIRGIMEKIEGWSYTGRGRRIKIYGYQKYYVRTETN